MMYIIGFTLGVIFAILFTGRAIKFEIKHIHETITAPISDADIAALERSMDTPDPDVDRIYEEMGTVLNEVADVMKGSDRI